MAGGTYTIRYVQQYTACRQAVRSLGPLGCTAYAACTGGLATRWSTWDLDSLAKESGTRHLGTGFALRCCQRLSVRHVAIQRWRWPSNWHTSGVALSVLSYWR